jgi:hypothetical protein
VFGQVKHIVFNIDGLLVQGIPAANYQAFTHKDQMLGVKNGSRTSYYYIYPNTSHLLNFIQKKNNFVIHFATNMDLHWARSVLQGIALPPPIKDSVLSYIEENGASKILTKDDLVNGKTDLRKITNDLNNVIIVTATPDITVPSQKKNELLISPNLFYFETYEFAEQARASAADSIKSSFPTTREEWFTDQNKMAYIYQLFKEAKADQTSNLVQALTNVKKDPVVQTQLGLRVARFKFEEEVTLFKYNDDKSKIIGCGVYDTIKDQFKRNLPIDDCLKLFSLKYTYKFNEQTRRPIACEQREEATGALIKTLSDYNACFDAIKNRLLYHWIGEARVLCSAYYNDYYITDSDPSNCSFTHVFDENGKVVIKTFFLVSGKPLAIIPEIASLSRGGTIDDVYGKYDPLYIGYSLIQWYRIQRGELEEDLTSANYDFKNDTRVAMAFNFRNIDSIISRGFLNQFESGTSNGLFRPSTRIEREDTFLTLKLGNLDIPYATTMYKVRPKYSYVLLDKHRPDMGLGRLYTQYGNVFAVFKDMIKQRSTFTPGDSLDIRATSADVRTFWYKSKSVLSLRRVTEYWEAQTWGPVTLDDVDYLLVNCFEPLTQTDINKLKSTKIPVYSCNVSWNGSNPYNATRGAKL